MHPGFRANWRLVQASLVAGVASGQQRLLGNLAAAGLLDGTGVHPAGLRGASSDADFVRRRSRLDAHSDG